MIKCLNLSKNYGEVKALSDVNIEFTKGKIIGLLGSNGSGKTTLIKLITGLLVPSGGEVLINGKKIGIASKNVIAYLPENSFLDLNMKVSEAVKYFSDFFSDFDSDKANRLLETLKIPKHFKLKSLSKGTKEKVQLILTISRKAQFYILDEPIGGVDPAARDNIIDTILTNFNEDAAVIISTHLISDVERILDEVVFIKEGKILLHTDADKLRQEKGKSIDNIFREEFKC